MLLQLWLILKYFCILYREETNVQEWTVDTFDGVNVSMESGVNSWSLERNYEECEGIEVMEMNVENENLEEDILVTKLPNLQVVPVASESIAIPTVCRVLPTTSPHEGNENLEEDNGYESFEVQTQLPNIVPTASESAGNSTVCHDLPITSPQPRRNGDDMMLSMLAPTESIVKPEESMEWNDEDTEEVTNTYEGNENLEEDNSYESLEVQSIVKPEASSCNTIRERLVCNTPNSSLLCHRKNQLVFSSQTNDVEMKDYAQRPQQTIVEGSNEYVCNLELPYVDNIPVVVLPQQESNLELPHSKTMRVSIGESSFVKKLQTEESGIEVKTEQVSVSNSVKTLLKKSSQRHSKFISTSSLPYQSSQEMDTFLSRSVAESQHGGGLFAIPYKKGKCIIWSYEHIHIMIRATSKYND